MLARKVKARSYAEDSYQMYDKQLFLTFQVLKIFQSENWRENIKKKIAMVYVDYGKGKINKNKLRIKKLSGNLIDR